MARPQWEVEVNEMLPIIVIDEVTQNFSAYKIDVHRQGGLVVATITLWSGEIGEAVEEEQDGVNIRTGWAGGEKRIYQGVLDFPPVRNDDGVAVYRLTTTKALA
jgi:hypothetical protein